MDLIGDSRSLGVPVTTLHWVTQVYLKSFKAIFYTRASLSRLGLVSSVFLEEIELKREDRGKQRFEDDESDRKTLYYRYM